eukprot:298903_1
MGILSNEPIGQVINQVSVIFAITHNGFLFLFHIYRSKSLPAADNISKIKCLSYPTIITAILYCIFSVMILYDLFPSDINCKWQVITGLIIYCISKLSLYYLFLERLFSVFYGTDFQFPKFQVYFGKISLILWMVILGSIIGIFGDGEKASNDDTLYLCVTNYPFWLNILVAIGDIIICSVISMTFATHLLQYEQQYYNNIRRNAEMEILTETEPLNMGANNAISLNQIARKSIILTLVALITTPVSLICAAIFGLTPLWTTMDSIINVWCVVLIFGINHRLFEILCGSLESKISITCLSWCTCFICCGEDNDEVYSQLDQTVSK